MHAYLKIALVGIVVAFAGLFIISTFVPPPASERQRAAQFFTESEIETGLQYSFERKLLSWPGTFIELGLLIAFVATGAARRLCDFYARWTGYTPDTGRVPPADDRTRMQRLRHWTGDLLRWLATLVLIGATYALADAVLQFPLAVARHFHSVAWGMTTQPFADWLGQYVLSLGVMWVVEAIAGIGLYLLLRWFPRTWYLVGTIGGALFAAAGAFLLPVLVAPLFNTFTPLAETEWKALEPRVRRLTDQAGIHINAVYVVDASRQGSHTNAYFTGLGATQSIVLYDTLLKQHPPDEVESILAHEIGHWIHWHIINGILLGAAAALVGLIVMDRMLRWLMGRPPVYLRSLSDPAGLPLVLLLGYLGGWIAMPLQNAVSRHFERQADATSLQMAGMPDVFIAAEERLARDNKSNVVPAPWNVWFFSTHPPAIERIEMAVEWRRSTRPPPDGEGK